MREILFRGLHRRKGEYVRLDGKPVESKWVYGGYFQYSEKRGMICQTEPEIDKFPVYVDTVGQYTGLNDKNGTKIFEGDILEFVDYFGNQHKGVVCWTSGSYDVDCTKNDNEEDEDFFRLYSACFNGAKVIGNIHDGGIDID